MIKNYKKLCRNINRCMDLHSNSTKLIDRNYKIENIKEFEKLIEIMKEEAEFNRPDARNALAFLYYYGIGVYKNRDTSLELFQRAAKEGNDQAHFMCYSMLGKDHPDKYIHFTKALLSNYPKAINSLGFLLEHKEMKQLMGN